jgi:hypothetical protein
MENPFLSSTKHHSLGGCPLAPPLATLLHEMIFLFLFQSRAIQERLDELHRLWDLLLIKLAEKGLRLQQALVRDNDDAV